MKDMLDKLKNLEDELAAINKEVKTLPTGRLNKRGDFYYHSTNGNEIGTTKNPDLIRLLCRKRFLSARKMQLENNITTLSQAIGKLDHALPTEALQSLPSLYQELPNDYFYHPEVTAWLAEPYTQNSYLPEERNYISKNGTPVRSKSEVLIASQLDEYGIPYRYDAAITFGTQTIYPDFTIKSPFTGKLIIWEHFGALNQPHYEQKMNDKMRLYMKHGLMPFETLIYTFEFDISSDRRLQDLIENIIL